MPSADATTGTTETLVGMVEHHVRHRPDDIAIRFGERQWSWAQWAARIQRAAGALQAVGLQRGQCVAFLDKNHPACLETLLAASSLGAVSTIVNWRVIGDELVHVLNDSGARVLIVGAELHDAVDNSGKRLDALFGLPDRPLQLDFANGRLSVRNACNRIGGSYLIVEDHLQVTQMMHTMMACHDQTLMQRESTINSVLHSTPTLILSDEGSTPLLTLTADDGQTLTFSGSPVTQTP